MPSNKYKNIIEEYSFKQQKGLGQLPTPPQLQLDLLHASSPFI
jgi:hypothetical protein